MFGDSTLPATLSSRVFPPLMATIILVSNFMMESGVKATWISVLPPTGTTPLTGLTMRFGRGFGSMTWNVEKKKSVTYLAIFLESAEIRFYRRMLNTINGYKNREIKLFWQ